MSAEQATLPAALPVRSDPSPLGRPREYSAEDAQAVLDTIASGSTLLQAAKSLDIPLGTVRKWVERDPSFGTALSRARIESADGLAEQAVAIPDELDDGELTHERVGLARLRIQSRQWLASKLKPQAYGDKLELAGDLTVSVIVKRFAPDPDTIDVTPAVDNSVRK